MSTTPNPAFERTAASALRFLAVSLLATLLGRRSTRALGGMRKHCHAEGSLAAVVSHSAGERARASQRSMDSPDTEAE